MSDSPAQNERAVKAGTKKNRYDDGSWAVEYSEKDRVFTVKVLDYHAGPLNIALDELMRLTGKAAPATAPAAAVPPDRGLQMGISRKEKSLYIAVPEGWSGLLKISRKELYQCGKMMGKRGASRVKT